MANRPFSIATSVMERHVAVLHSVPLIATITPLPEAIQFTRLNAH